MFVRIAVITGMHRSGTSMVARVVNLLGVDFGPEDDLMEPKPDNPTGFWESLSVTGFNDDLLGFLGGRWDDPPVLEEGWADDPALEPWRERAARLLAQQFGSAELVGWKDPRCSITLPLWNQVAEVAATVLSLRDPREVAASLAARDGIESEAAARLWLRYVVAALRADRETLVVRYADFFGDLPATVARLVAQLGVDPPREETMKAIEAFCDPSLRHHRDVPPATGPTMQLAMTMFGVAGTPAGLALADHLQQAWLSVRREEQRDDLGRQVVELSAHRDDLIHQRNVAVAASERAIEERDEAHRRHVHSEERRRLQDARLGREEEENRRLGERVRDLQERLERTEAELAGARSRLAELERGPIGRIKARLRSGP